MKNSLLLFTAFLLVISGATGQTYHSDDKEGLRDFLRQPSAVTGQINAQRVGLSIIDTLNWENDEMWLNKLDLGWNYNIPRRLTSIHWNYKNIAGVLNCNMWTELYNLSCSKNQITYIEVSNNSALELLSCNSNQLSTLDVSNNTQLQFIQCDENHLPLSDLFAASTMVTLLNSKRLGTQILFPLSVNPEIELFENQSVFNGIYTNYIVTKNGSPASMDDYTVTNGQIVFFNSGFYEVSMTNDAITSNVNYPVKVIVDIVVLGAPFITTTTLPNCVKDYAYSETLSAIGITPITWALESGNLPTGLTLSSNGTISGTPSQEGAFSFTVNATNNIGNDTKQLSINILTQEFSDGNGTENSPYLITTQFELAQLALYCLDANTDYNDKYYKLNNDIDLSAYQSYPGWTPIGMVGSHIFAFKGHFDGNCKKISSVTCFDGCSPAGLFGYIVGGSVKKLTVENVDTYSSAASGSIAGVINNTTIMNCSATGNVWGHSSVGGIVGEAGKNCNIMSCYSSCNLIMNSPGDGIRVGGIVGNIDDGCNIKNCYFSGTILASAISGGIAGDISSLSPGTLISNCLVLSQKIHNRDDYNVGRIAGRGGIFYNNAAWDGILDKNDTINWAPKGASTLNGEDVNIVSIFADGTLGERFTEENGWSVENGKLPGLCGCAVDMPEHLLLAAAPKITTTTLPNGTVEKFYTQTLSATGIDTIMYEHLSGSLPTGLELSLEGTISGTPTEEGIFNFNVKAQNSAGFDTKMLSIIVISVLGLTENEISKISVYPNPTIGNLRVASGEKRIESIEIFDIYGRKQKGYSPPFMEGWQPQADGVVINISHLSAGLYFLRVNGQTVKVLKE